MLAMSQQSIIIHPHGIFCVSIILLLLKQIKKAKKKGYMDLMHIEVLAELIRNSKKN